MIRAVLVLLLLLVSVPVAAQSRWVAVAGGAYFSMGLRADGTVWAWGQNTNGQLGDGTTTNHSTPAQVGAVATWAKISAGWNHGLGIRTNGTLWSWGYNNTGQLGDGTEVNRLTPVQVGLSLWTAVSGGMGHTLAIKSDGTLWAWGSNVYGQIGNGSATTKFSTPVQIGTSTWIAISAGYYHSTAIRSDGTLWAWGLNSEGEVGDGTITPRTTPVQIGVATNWTAVSAGYINTFAINALGALYGWGDNHWGQIGDGTAIDRPAPIRVGTDNQWIQIAANNDHWHALRRDGTLWACGKNTHGQLGDGTTADKTVPTQMGVARWGSAVKSYYHSHSITPGGTLYGWGRNDSGQVGNGNTTTPQPTPIELGPTAVVRTVNGAGGANYTTIQACANAAQPGDTCLVAAGTYNEGGLRIVTAAGGTGDFARVKFLANGVVTVKGFEIYHPFVTVEGFDITGFAGSWSGSVMVYAAGTDFRYVGNTLRDTGPMTYGFVCSSGNGSTYTQRLVIQRNIFSNLGRNILQTSGTDILIEYNSWVEQNGQDVVRPSGRNVTFRRNYIQEGFDQEGDGQHPDFSQLFGSSNVNQESINILIEENWLQNLESQFSNINSGDSENRANGLVDRVHDIIYRRNVIGNVSQNANVTMPNVTFDHNTFFRWPYQQSGIAIGLGALTRGEASYATITNNAFIAGGAESDSIYDSRGFYSNAGMGLSEETLRLMLPTDTATSVAIAADLRTRGYLSGNFQPLAPAVALYNANSCVADLVITATYESFRAGICSLMMEVVRLDLQMKSTFVADYNMVTGSVVGRAYGPKPQDTCATLGILTPYKFCEAVVGHGINGGDPKLQAGAALGHGILAVAAFSSNPIGSWNATTKRLTATGAFTYYTPVAGDQIAISSGYLVGSDTATFSDAAGNLQVNVAVNRLLDTHNVSFTVTGGGVLPTGIVVGTSYYVTASTATSFQVRATRTGAPVVYTNAGTAPITASYNQEYGISGRYTVVQKISANEIELGTLTKGGGMLQNRSNVSGKPYMPPSVMLGPDGLPFTLDDGLKPMLSLSSPLCGAGSGGSDIGAYSCDPTRVFPVGTDEAPVMTQPPSAPTNVIIREP